MIIVRSKWLRRLELALWSVGLVLFGVAAASIATRWHYQEQQERALFDRGPAVSPVAVSPINEPVEQLPHVQSPVAGITKLIPQIAQPAVAQPKKPTPPADPTAIGRIEIPRLGLKAIVKEGGDDDTLERAVGLLPGSAHPGQSGNIVLAGHRDTFFWPLQDIERGDQIRIVLPQRTYRYRVDSIRVVDPDEASALASKGVEELTLVTCYPFRYVGPAPQRFIVSATRRD
ncbi:MAG TPA: sortase [Thermoanaerobaculia bacterium]|nr:sortase [Thermoanaerobaculia bacterium]